MSDHFINITNGLKVLEKNLPNKKMMKKMLGSIPNSWEAKVLAIKEFKDQRKKILLSNLI